MTLDEQKQLSFDIIEIFEDFLEARDVRIPTSDRAFINEWGSELSDMRIYGTDFTQLRYKILVAIIETDEKEGGKT